MTDNNENNNNQPESDQESLELRDREEAESHEHLGLAGRLTCTFIDSPITPLLVGAALFVGLLGLIFTPRQEDPQVSVPMVDIFVQYPGASADQVASLATRPLERIMSTIPGVRHVYSMTDRGRALVTVRFFVGEPMGPSIVKVQKKLQSNLDKIPPGVSMPLVKPKSVDDVPLVSVTLSSKDVDDAALRSLGVDVLQRLQEVPNTSVGFVVGGRAEEVRVDVLPERLVGYGITMDQLSQVIRAANKRSLSGDVEANNRSFSVYTGDFLHNAREVGGLVVATRGDKPVYLRDIASVTDGPEDAKHIGLYYTGPAAPKNIPPANGEQAVTIAIAKKHGTNGVSVANDILARLELLKGRLIPDNVRVSITRNYGKTANDKVNDLLEAMFIAAGAVAVLCLLVLGMRAAFVVITVIPIVILLSIFSAYVMHFTIDRVSLFAMIFSIGILVDDAAVVVENIYRRWMLAGRSTVGIAIDAVREVGNPTILATMTIIAALLPMAVVRGLMGPYMLPIPILGSVAMLFSLLAAFMMTPWMTLRVRPSGKAFEKAEKREERTRKMIAGIYDPVIKKLIENRLLGVLFLVSVIGLTAASCVLFYTKTVQVKILPLDNKPNFSVVLNMPEGTALPVTANVLEQLTQIIRTKVPEATAVQSYAGTAQPYDFNGLVRHYYLRQEPWQGDLQVMLTGKHERKRSSHQIADEVRTLITPVVEKAGGRVQVVEMPPGPPVLSQVVAEIHGPDTATRHQFAHDMVNMFKQAPGIVDVDSYMSDPYTYWAFEVDRDKAARNGVSVSTIARNVAMAMGKQKLGDVKLGAPLEPTYIVMQVPLKVRSQVSRLSNLPIPATSGKTVPLSELGHFVQQYADQYIYHKDLRSVEYVTGTMVGKFGAPIYGMFDVEDLLDNYTAPDGVKVTGMPMGLIGPPDNDLHSGFEWSGEWTVTYETFRDMGLAFMAALVLIYGLIVLEFRDYTLAGLIMSPIPLTLIGVISGHWIMSADFTATSMIGFIALAGIVVRNSILIVEFVKNEVENGKDIREAAVTAGRTRLRPIVITSLTVIIGAWAIVFDPIFQGMAVALMFGAGVAVPFTMLVIPLGCISAEKHFKRHSCEALEERLEEQEENKAGKGSIEP